MPAGKVGTAGVSNYSNTTSGLATRVFAIDNATTPSLPTLIFLSTTYASQNLAVGSVVAMITATGAPTPTYSIVLDADGKFSITGSQLKLAAALNYAVKTSHNVTIRATNSSGSVNKVFTITVLPA